MLQNQLQLHWVQHLRYPILRGCDPPRGADSRTLASKDVSPNYMYLHVLNRGFISMIKYRFFIIHVKNTIWKVITQKMEKKYRYQCIIWAILEWRELKKGCKVCSLATTLCWITCIQRKITLFNKTNFWGSWSYLQLDVL